MLDYIDNMLRQFLITQVPGIASPLQVRFQPPDDDWRTYVSTLGKVALNVYLIELKENRELRSCGRLRELTGGVISEKQMPRWIDAHYFITAWDPATPQPAVEPVIVEHELLWNTASALMDAGALIPTKIYAPNPLPVGFPALIENTELPATVLPADGFGKHAEFWGTMPGQNHPWRPAVLLIVSLPVSQPVISVSHMVTTRITYYGPLAGGGRSSLASTLAATLPLTAGQTVIGVTLPAGLTVAQLAQEFPTGWPVTVSDGTTNEVVTIASFALVAGAAQVIIGAPGLANSYTAQTTITLGAAPDVWAEIGGTVSDATVAPPVPVPGANVSLVTSSGEALMIATTDSQGRFIFNTLRPGNYQLQFSASGHPAAVPRNITVPSPTGEYNLQFT